MTAEAAGMSKDGTIEVDGRTIGISHPEKLLFPDDGISKADLARYIVKVAPAMLPLILGRPLSYQRFPDGIGEGGFFQKQAGDYFPEWVRRAPLAKEGGSVDYVVADSAATLVYLVGQGTIVLHAGLARVDRPDHPDRLIVDLDPSDGDFAKVVRAAHRLKDLLDALDLPSFVMTTGSRGLHVVLPLDREVAFDAVRGVAHDLAGRLADAHADELTVEQRKAKRGDRVFLDVARNAYGQTGVAPYSPRALSGAPVATPLAWPEVDAKGMTARRWTVANIFRRLARRADPWKDIDRAPLNADAIGRALARLGPRP
jgi:bifunctional non-homologous end joining protein LigD